MRESERGGVGGNEEGKEREREVWGGRAGFTSRERYCVCVRKSE